MSDAAAVQSVLVWNPDGEPRSSALAAHLNLPEVADRDGGSEQLYLFFQDQQLVVGRNPRLREKPFAIDFVKQFRDRHRGKELLLKAIGGRRAELRILDATAGLGRDSFLLASYGATVTLCERNPIVAAMLADGISRGQHDPDICEMVSRMELQTTGAHSILAAMSETQQPDVVYLDPMFPESGKSALVKKEMRLFHSLVGMDNDADALLDLALQAAKHRVVVKRSPHAPPLGGRPPQFAVAGKAVRFDVYPLKAFNKS